MNDTISTLDTLSRTVAEQHGALQTAIADEREAEAQLLEKIVDAVRPALKALSSRIRATERVFWPDSVSTATEETWHAERAVPILVSGPQHDHPRADEGAIVGRDLVLLTDGTFARLDWSGNWTRWQGRTSAEESTLTRISTLDVVQTWNVEDVATKLRVLLEAQVNGKAPKTAQAARDRAEKLRAVAQLLGGRK